MRTRYIIVLIISAIGLGVLLYFVMQDTAVGDEAGTLRQETRDLGRDAAHGVEDAVEATRKAAEDAKNGIKDAVK